MKKTVYDLVDKDSYRGDVPLATYLSREEAECDLDHYEERYNCTLKIVKRLEEAVVQVETSWCVDDVRHRLEEEVKDMTDKEIQKELDRLAKGFHEACVQSGWDVIDNCFELKENK